MKALEILKVGVGLMNKAIESNPMSKNELLSEIKIYNEAIKELEALIEKDKSCNGCKHLEERELGLRNSCVFEICRSCCRNNNDNWELNNEC